MENIIITSSGFNSVKNYVSDDNIKLFKKIAKDKKVLIIANAAKLGGSNYVARENVKENFLNVGAKIVDIIELYRDNISVILQYDVIYVLGGNLTNLVELHQTTNFKKTLITFLKKGIYIGESAGSIILADNVKWLYELKKGTKPKYDVVLDSYEGLGLVDKYIYPHYQKEDKIMQDKISRYELSNGITITRLNDGEVINFDYKG